MARRLVSPQRTLHIVADKESLTKLVDGRGLEKKKAKELKGNLAQLCGWNDVGADRDGRGETNNWQLLDGIRWLQRDGCDEVVPLVGKYDHIAQGHGHALQKGPACAAATRAAAVDGATWVRAPGVSSPHPTGDVPLLGDRRHHSGAPHLHHRLEPPAPPRLCRGCPCPCCRYLLMHTAHAVGVHVPVRLHLLMVAETAGAAHKGHFRVRHFGGVFVFAALLLVRVTLWQVAMRLCACENRC